MNRHDASYRQLFRHPHMALRSATYCGLQYESLLQHQQIKPGTRLPVVLPVVLYSGVKPWTEPTVTTDLIDQAPSAPRLLRLGALYATATRLAQGNYPRRGRSTGDQRYADRTLKILDPAVENGRPSRRRGRATATLAHPQIRALTRASAATRKVSNANAIGSLVVECSGCSNHG